LFGNGYCVGLELAGPIFGAFRQDVKGGVLSEVGEGIARGIVEQTRPNGICQDGEMKMYVHDDDEEDATDMLMMVVI
jgi:hypothetical protein